MGIWIDARPEATDEKRADQCSVSVGGGGSSRVLLFPLESADELNELITALQVATLCECVVHGCAS